jgi:hypothetical protein
MVFGGKRGGHSHFEGPNGEKVVYDRYRLQHGDADFFRRVCYVDPDKDEVVDWLYGINNELKAYDLTLINTDNTGKAQNPVAALMSLKGGSDQGFHRDFSLENLAKFSANTESIPNFMVLALMEDTRVKYVPGSHLAGQPEGMDMAAYTAMTEVQMLAYLDSVAHVVDIKIGEMAIFHGGLLHAGMGYAQDHIRLHAYCAHAGRFNGNETEVRLDLTCWSTQQFNAKRVECGIKPFVPVDADVDAKSSTKGNPFGTNLVKVLTKLLKGQIGVNLHRCGWKKCNYKALSMLLGQMEELPTIIKYNIMGKGGVKKTMHAKVNVNSPAWNQAVAETIRRVSGVHPIEASGKQYKDADGKKIRLVNKWVPGFACIETPTMKQILDDIGFVTDHTVPLDVQMIRAKGALNVPRSSTNMWPQVLGKVSFKQIYKDVYVKDIDEGETVQVSEVKTVAEATVIVRGEVRVPHPCAGDGQSGLFAKKNLAATELRAPYVGKLSNTKNSKTASNDYRATLGDRLEKGKRYAHMPHFFLRKDIETFSGTLTARDLKVAEWRKRMDLTNTTYASDLRPVQVCACPKMKWQSGGRAQPTSRCNDLSHIASRHDASGIKTDFEGFDNVANLPIYLELVLRDKSTMLVQVPMGVFSNLLVLAKDDELSLEYGTPYWSTKKYASFSSIRKALREQTDKLVQVTSDLRLYKDALRVTARAVTKLGGWPHATTRKHSKREKALHNKAVKGGHRRNMEKKEEEAKEAAKKKKKTEKTKDRQTQKKPAKKKPAGRPPRQDAVQLKIQDARLVANYQVALRGFLKLKVPMETFADLKRVDYKALDVQSRAYRWVP